VIIKAAKRIFNSDKICCSYYDFYFGVTFLEHTVYIYSQNRNDNTVNLIIGDDFFVLFCCEGK